MSLSFVVGSAVLRAFLTEVSYEGFELFNFEPEVHGLMERCVEQIVEYGEVFGLPPDLAGEFGFGCCRRNPSVSFYEIGIDEQFVIF